MEKTITVIRGDGIGPEIVNQAIRILDRIAEKFGHTFHYQDILAGGCAIDAYGASLPKESLETCLNCDSVLLGAVGGPKWDGVPKEIRPEAALLGIRSAMGLYANLRPARLFHQLSEASPLKPEITEKGIDLMMVRELTGGAYFGAHVTSEENGELVAHDDMNYSVHEIRRIARTAFDIARKRDSRVISVDKANVLDTSRLWRKIVHEVAAEYPDVTCTDMLVDNTAMQLVRNPSQFDVIVTENLFGDILSDEASMITGSIGMMASASLGEGTRGMYEPIHGSAPDIAGQNIANPIGTILSAAMMLRYSFDLPEEASCIESAVDRVLNAGIRTGDIWSEGTAKVTCSGMGDAILAQIG